MKDDFQSIPGYVPPDVSGGGVAFIGGRGGLETHGGSAGKFANVQPLTNTKGATDGHRVDPRERDGSFPSSRDPLLRVPTSLVWGGSNDNLIALAELGRQIAARLPVLPTKRAGKTGAGKTGAGKTGAGKTGAGDSEVDALFNEFDDGKKAPSNTSTGRASVAIPTPVPVAGGGNSLGIILAVLGLLASIGGVLYYEYRHKHHAG